MKIKRIRRQSEPKITQDYSYYKITTGLLQDYPGLPKITQDYPAQDYSSPKTICEL